MAHRESITSMTTRDRVKRRADILGDKLDDLIDELITEVSADATTYLGRHIISESHTEVYRLRSHQHTFSLKGAPATSVTSLKYHMRDGQWSDVAAVDSTLYNADLQLAQIYLRFNTPYHPGYAQVVYVGGMATESATEDTETANFIAAYPQLAGAIDQQVVEILRRRKTPTGSLTTRGSSVQHQFDIGLLRDVRRRLDQFRRRVW